MLLANGFVQKIALNDLDIAIYAFWWSILNETDKFCNAIDGAPVCIEEWHRQKHIWQNEREDLFTLGFATYFLNRTNRSGIIDGAGPIGGYSQAGNWKIDVRFNKKAQIENIEMISTYKDRIALSNADALDFIQEKIHNPNSFLYLDPPYYVKGRKLYKNFYEHENHLEISNTLRKLRNKKWILSYDDVNEIRELYTEFQPYSYDLNYSAGKKGVGKEVIFVSDSIKLPMHPQNHCAA